MARIGKNRLKQAISENGGVIASLAEQFNVTRQTIYNWLDKYDLRDEIEHARADIHDVAEANIYRAVMGGDLDMSKFVLTHMLTRDKVKWSSRHQVDSNSIQLSPKAVRLLEELGVQPDNIGDEFEQLIQDLHAEALRDDPTK